MLTPSNKLGRRCGARRRRHAVADAAVFVSAILAALVAVAARARALSPGSPRALIPGKFPTRPSVNKVPAAYHLLTIGAAASTCPRIVDITFSEHFDPDQPPPWGVVTDMIMPVAKSVCSTRVWYVVPSNSKHTPYELNDEPKLSKRISQSRRLEQVTLMFSVLAKSFLPLLGWTDGQLEAVGPGCHAWLTPRWTFWAFFTAASEPMPLRLGGVSYGTLPAGARGALLSTGEGNFCAYVVLGDRSSTLPPFTRGDAERLRTPPSKEGSLSSAAWRVTTGIGIGLSLVATLAVAAGVAVVRRRLAAPAEARETSDGDGTDRSGCPHCVGGYGADVGVNCLVHVAGEVVTDAAGGGADHHHGAAGVVAYTRALDGSMVGSIGDDLTVDGLFCTYPPRADPAARRPRDSTQSIGSSEGGAPVSSLSDHMDVDGLVREALQLPPPPQPP